MYNNFYRELATRYYKSGNYKKLEEILPEMDMVMINDVFRKGVEFAIRKTPTPPETYVEISKKFIDQMIAKVGDGSYAQTVAASPRQAERLPRLWMNYNICHHAQVAEKCRRYQDAQDVMK